MPDLKINETVYSGIREVQIPKSSGGMSEFASIDSGTLRITKNGTSDVTHYSAVTVEVESSSGGTAIKLQSKPATPSAIQQTIKPDSNYDGLSQVIVYGDADLIAGNIKKGVEIFGVTGSYESSSGSGIVIKSGKTSNPTFGTGLSSVAALMISKATAVNSVGLASATYHADSDSKSCVYCTSYSAVGIYTFSPSTSDIYLTFDGGAVSWTGTNSAAFASGAEYNWVAIGYA